MRKLQDDIYYRRKKIDIYSKEVISLLNKKEYNNFLMVYVRLLHDNLIKYNELVRLSQRMNMDNEQKDTTKDKKTQTERGNHNKYRWW